LKLHGEEAYEQYSSEAEFTYSELEEKLKEKYENFSFDENKTIEIKEYNSSGRIKTIQFGNVNISGVEARSILGLKSAMFSIEKSDDKVIFKVKGYGHGVRNEPNRSRCTSKTRRIM